MEDIRPELIEVPLACPDCDSLNVKTSLVKYRKVSESTDRFGLGILCLNCLKMNILEFKVLKELLNWREKKLKEEREEQTG